VKRYRTEIVADNMIMLDRKGAPTGGGDEMMPYAGKPVSACGHQRKPRRNRTTEAASAPVSEEEVTIDDLPF